MITRRSVMTGTGAAAAAVAVTALPAERAAAAPTSYTGWYNVATTYGSNIQSAINAAQAAGGGVVYCPAGTYTAANLSITGNNIMLLGDGPQATTIQITSTSGTFMTIGSSGNSTLFTSIKDIAFEPPAASSRTGYTLYFLNCQGVYMNNVWLGQHLPQGSTVYTLGGGIGIDNVGIGTSFGVLDAVQMSRCSANSLDIGRFSSSVPPSDIFVSNCNFGGNTANGIVIGWVSGLYVTNSEVTGGSSSSNGIVMAPASPNWCAYVFLDNILVDTFNGQGIYMTGSGVIADIRLTGCYSNNHNGQGVLFDNGNAASIGVSITGGEFCNNVGAGIEWYGGGGFIINGALCFANAKNSSGSQNGINITNNASGFQIVNCLSGKGGFLNQTNNFQNYGIQVSSGCNNYIVANNRCPGNVSGGVSAATSATQIVSNNLAV